MNLGERLVDPDDDVIPSVNPEDDESAAEVKLRTSFKVRDTIDFLKQWEERERGNDYSANQIHGFLVKWAAATHVKRHGLADELEKFLAHKKAERASERTKSKRAKR